MNFIFHLLPMISAPAIMMTALGMFGCTGLIITSDGRDSAVVDGENIDETGADADGGDIGGFDGDSGGPDEASDSGPDGDGSDGDGGGPDEASDSGPDGDGASRPDNGPCPSQLQNRLQIHSVIVEPDRINPFAGDSFSHLTPPIISETSQGSMVAWQDTSSQIHVTPLDVMDNRSAPDIKVEGNELRGFTTHENGFGLLFQRGTDEMAIVGFDTSAQVVFDVTIIGNNTHEQQGDKWIRREWGDYGRMDFFNDKYAVYFGHTMNWGDQGIHQGDLLWYFDQQGNKSGGLWDWGCSHSLDVRLTHNSNRLAPVCLSDCYPSKAICFNHTNAVISQEPSGNCSGSSSASLGGLVATTDGFLFVFASDNERPSHDIGFVFISNKAEIGDIHWLTDTPDVQESNAHLARYGDDFLVAWQGSGQHLAVVDSTGSFIMGPVEVSAGFSQQTDFKTFRTGDVMWADGSGSELQINRVRLCQ